MHKNQSFDKPTKATSSFEKGRRNFLYQSAAVVGGVLVDSPGHISSVQAEGFSGSNGQYAVSLVNTTSGGKRPVRELVPVNNIKVEIDFKGETLKQQKILRSKGSCTVNYTNQVIAVELDILEDFASIYLETEKEN